MHRRSMVLGFLLLVLALPLAASQFVQLSFDQVARESDLIVRGTVESTFTAWDDAHEVIFTYATIRVNRYFGESTGPDTLVVREVGGTVDGYTQEAIGFPAIRQGENVVLFLSRWDDGNEYRIHAYNQGKYLVGNRGGREVVMEDPVKQGEERLSAPGRVKTNEAEEGLMTIEELSEMVDVARAGGRTDGAARQR